MNMISIIIVNYKNPALLKLCLSSVYKSMLSDTKYEVIVVDGASSIETRNIVNEDFNNARYLPFKQNVGYTRGVNEGLKISSGDSILILNPDVVPLTGSIEKLSDHLIHNPTIGMVGPQLLNFDGSIQDSTFRFYDLPMVIYRRSFLGRFGFAKTKLNALLMKDMDRSSAYSADWLMGSSYMISGKALDKVGYLDENFFMYMSDVDWAKRFWENGYRIVYYPDSKMYHYHQRASKGPFDIFDVLLKKESRWHLIDAYKYFKKYGINTTK